METLLSSLPNSPVVSFTVLLLVILTVPPIFEKLRLPGLVGLLVAGVILGSDGLGLLDAQSETMKLLSDVGKIYLMFVAGLEIDLAEFRKTKNKSLSFGLATFVLPLIGGVLVGRMFGFGWNSSILIGSLLASHTLLGYPIVNRLGVVNNPAVTVTIGATIFTDIAALLVLAICVSIEAGEFSTASLIFQLISLVVYAAIVLFGFDWAGKEYFRRTGDEESNQFLFVLLAVFLASVGAQIINVDKIVGAFLAGLAVNDVVEHSPVEEKVVFVGSTLFIPFFFVNMGLLLNISSLATTLTSNFLLTLAIIATLFVSKFLAACLIKIVYRYNWYEALTMWSLSLPQVAATLAAALVGLNAGLIDDSVFNAVIVLMIVTAVIGPILTDKFARQLAKPGLSIQTATGLGEFKQGNNLSFYPLTTADQTFTVVVPIANPDTQKYLIEMGALLARQEAGVVIPLSIVKAHLHMDDPELDNNLQQSRKILAKALKVCQEFSIKTELVLRIDDDTAHGITRCAREKNANLIIMGWRSTSTIQARLLGNTIDSVLWSTHCPVAVVKLVKDPVEIQTILVPVKNITFSSLRTIQFACLFAASKGAKVTLLHISDRQTPKTQLETLKIQLAGCLTQINPTVEYRLKIMRRDDLVPTILRISNNYDLIVLRSVRRRTAGGLAVSDITNKLISQLNCSMVLFGEPHAV